MPENYFPSFKQFSRCNDYYRLKIKRKPRNKKWVKVVYYPFVILGLVLLGISLIVLIITIKSHSGKSYRNSKNYRKVIKEGLLWNTVEYHER